MKRLIAFLLLFIPFASFADDIAAMSANDVIAIFDETLPVIEERISKLNPDLVKGMSGADKFDKIYEYNNFMVHYIFDEKTQYYIDMLYKHCKQTGCTVESDGTYYNIEQADLSMDRPECYRDGTGRGIRTCPYPSNYDFSWLVLLHNEFYGFIDDLNRTHFYRLLLDDSGASYTLSIHDTEFAHDTLLTDNNQALICNSEDLPHVRAYKECRAQDPEPKPNRKRCKDEALTAWFMSEHKKCLEEHKAFWEVKVQGGWTNGLKNW